MRLRAPAVPRRGCWRRPFISASFSEENRGRIGTWSGFTTISAGVGPVFGAGSSSTLRGAGILHQPAARGRGARYHMVARAVEPRRGRAVVWTCSARPRRLWDSAGSAAGWSKRAARFQRRGRRRQSCGGSRAACNLRRRRAQTRARDSPSSRYPGRTLEVTGRLRVPRRRPDMRGARARERAVRVVADRLNGG